MKQPVFLFGGSGHAKVITDIIEHLNTYDLLWVVDDDPALKGRSLFGYPIIGGKNELIAEFRKNRELAGLVAIGVNSARRKVASWFVANDIPRISVAHPSAQISRGVKIGTGVAIMAQAVVNADTVFGDEVILNTSASVDHDCLIGAGTHIAPGARICGGVTIGEGCMIGAGAVVLPNVRIGNGTVVGAGATVVGDLPADVVVVGTPARVKAGA